MNHLRKWSLSLTVLALGAAMAPAKPLTFAHRAANLTTVLERLSEATGQVLVADKAIEREIVLINVSDRESDDVLRQLATTFGAEWKTVTLNRNGTSVEGLKLVRSTKAIQDAERVEIESRRQAYAVGLRAVKDDLAKNPSFNDQRAKDLMDGFQSAISSATSGGGGAPGPGGRPDRQTRNNFMNLMNQSPGARAIARALEGVDLNLLAAMPPQSRLVFSTVPTMAQRRLGNAGLEAARVLVQEDQVMRSAFEASGMRMAFGGGSASASASASASGGASGSATGGATAAMLVVTRMGSGDALSVSFIAADSNGNALANGFMTLGFNPEPATEDAAANVLQSEKATIKLSAEAVSLARILNANESGGGETVMTVVSNGSSTQTMASGPDSADLSVQGNLLDKIAQPDVYDPLSFTVGEMIEQSAVALDRDLVAWIPDSLFAPMARVGQASSITTTLVVNTVKQGATVKNEDGWWIVVPNRPNETIEGRLNRSALKSFMATLRTDGFASLDARANYIAAQPRNLESGQIETTLVAAVNPGEPLAGGGGGRRQFGLDRAALRFYGTLPTSLRDTLKQGGQVPINVLTGPQLAALNDIVFASMDGPQRTTANANGGPNNGGNRGGGRGQRGPGGQDGPGGMAGPAGGTMTTTIQVGGRAPGGPGGPGGGRFAGFGGFGSMNMAEERTYVLGSGLPKTGFISAAIRDEQAVLGRTNGGSTRLLDTGDLAMNRLSNEGVNMPFGPRNQTPLVFTRFRPVTERDIRLTFTLQPEYSMTRNLQDLVMNSTSQFTGYDSLPAAFREAVDSTYAERKEMMNRMGERMRNGDMGPGRGGGRRGGGPGAGGATGGSRVP